MKQRLPNRCFLLALWAGIAFAAHAQNEPIKFGKVELADLQMKTYDKDTSAAAVVLCDYGKAFINNEAQVELERTIRIKILKRSGYDWATKEIYFTRGMGGIKIKELKGYTHNLENGQIVKEKLEKESIFTENKIKDLYLQKFTLPNVKVGSVIEYTYRVASSGLAEFHPWAFQTTIPTIWSEYRISYPDNLHYKIQMSGYHPAAVSANQGTNYRWVYKDVPAIRPEAYITTINDYVSKVEFELGSVNIPGVAYKSFSEGWSSTNELLLNDENFGAQLKRSGFLKDVVAQIKKDNTDPAQQAFAAYEHIRKHMKWNEGTSIYSSGNKKIYDTKTGDCADINLLLLALLRDIGLDAKPVLLSTRDNGKVLPFYATLTKFNYVVAIVKVGDKNILLDATDEHITPGLLPTRCLNGIGRIIDLTNGDWISLETKEKAVEMFSAQLTLNEDGELTGQVERSRAGYGAWEQRKKIISTGKEKHTETLKKEYPTWEIQKVELLNLEKPNEVLSEKFTVSTSEGGQKAGNAIYLKPMLGEAMKENPFKLTDRKYPVDFATPMETTYVSSFTLPAGYKVEESPKNLLLSLPENAGRFMFTVAVNGNTVQVVSKVIIRKPVFYAEEYAALREFYNQIVSKHAEQIVLKKG